MSEPPPPVAVLGGVAVLERWAPPTPIALAPWGRPVVPTAPLPPRMAVTLTVPPVLAPPPPALAPMPPAAPTPLPAPTLAPCPVSVVSVPPTRATKRRQVALHRHPARVMPCAARSALPVHIVSLATSLAAPRATLAGLATGSTEPIRVAPVIVTERRVTTPVAPRRTRWGMVAGGLAATLAVSAVGGTATKRWLDGRTDAAAPAPASPVAASATTLATPSSSLPLTSTVTVPQFGEVIAATDGQVVAADAGWAIDVGADWLPVDPAGGAEMQWLIGAAGPDYTPSAAVRFEAAPAISLADYSALAGLALQRQFPDVVMDRPSIVNVGTRQIVVLGYYADFGGRSLRFVTAVSPIDGGYALATFTAPIEAFDEPAATALPYLVTIRPTAG